MTPRGEKRNWPLEMAVLQADRDRWKSRAEEAEARVERLLERSRDE